MRDVEHARRRPVRDPALLHQSAHHARRRRRARGRGAGGRPGARRAL